MGLHLHPPPPAPGKLGMGWRQSQDQAVSGEQPTCREETKPTVLFPTQTSPVEWLPPFTPAQIINIHRVFFRALLLLRVHHGQTPIIFSMFIHLLFLPSIHPCFLPFINTSTHPPNSSTHPCILLFCLHIHPPIHPLIFIFILSSVHLLFFP